MQLSDRRTCETRDMNDFDYLTNRELIVMRRPIINHFEIFRHAKFQAGYHYTYSFYHWLLKHYVILQKMIHTKKINRLGNRF